MAYYLTLLGLACILNVAFASNAQGVAFLEENRKAEGVIELPSGLQYKVLRKGEGTVHPGLHTECECSYRGTLIDGQEFDSSYKRNRTHNFKPSQVIKGWTEALQLMVAGDKWQLYIPSDLAYGDTPKGFFFHLLILSFLGHLIKAGDVLIFEIELVSIVGKSDL